MGKITRENNKQADVKTLSSREDIINAFTGGNVESENIVEEAKPQKSNKNIKSFSSREDVIGAFTGASKKKDGGEKYSTSPTTSQSPSQSVENPIDFINKDIENNGFLSSFNAATQSIVPQPFKDQNVEVQQAMKKEIFSSPDALAKYNERRIDQLKSRENEIKKELKKFTFERGESFGLFSIGGDEEFTASSFGASSEENKKKIKSLNDELTQIRDYQNKLKNNVATIATDLVLTQTDFSQFDPKQIGRKLIGIADPDLNAKIKLAEKNGGSIPGYTRAELAKLGINSTKDFLERNKYNPNYFTKELYDKTTAIVDDFDKKFDEDNPEYTAQRVREKLGAYFYKKGNGGVFGYSQRQLKDAVNDLETGLTESEKKIALNNVIPIEDKISGTFIPGSGFFRSAQNALDKSIASTNKSILSFFGARDDSDRARELLNTEVEQSGLRPVGESQTGLSELAYYREKEKIGKLTKEEQAEKNNLEKYVDVRSNWSRWKDGAGDVLGQVAFTALLTRGVGGAGKLAGTVSKSGGLLTGGLTSGTVGAALSNQATGLFLSSYLNSYDNYRTQAIDVIKGEDKAAERNAYAITMASIEGLSERIFADTKILKSFTKSISPAVGNLATRLINKEITQQVAKEELQGVLQKSLKPFAKEFAKSTLQESTEEAVVDLADGISQSIFGGQPFDIAKTGQQAVNTFLTTALYSPVVSALAAHGSYRQQKSNNAFLKSSLVNIAANPTEYLKNVEDLQLNGEISQKDANDKIKLIKSAGNYLKELEQSRPVNVKVEDSSETIQEEKPFDYPEVTSYILHRLNEGVINDRLESTTDPILKEKLEKDLARSIEIRKGIFEGKLGVTPNLQEVAPDIKTANELGIAAAENLTPDDLIGTPFKPIISEQSEIKNADIENAEAKTTQAESSETAEVEIEKVNDFINKGVNIINNKLESGDIKGYYADIAKESPEGLLKYIADQSFGRGETGVVNEEDSAERDTIKNFGQDLVDIAKQAYPLQQSSIQSPIKTSTDEINDEKGDEERSPEVQKSVISKNDDERRRNDEKRDEEEVLLTVPSKEQGTVEEQTAVPSIKKESQENILKIFDSLSDVDNKKSEFARKRAFNKLKSEYGENARKAKAINDNFDKIVSKLIDNKKIEKICP